MDKLVNKFEDIYFEHVMYKDDEAFKSVKIYVEETKKIAVEFSKWVESNFYRQPFTQEYSRVTNDPTLWPENFRRVGVEELFDKFIEEYYE